MVAAPVLRRLGRPPHLPEGHDERLGEEPGTLEIEQEGRKGLVEGGEEEAADVVGVDVRVPAVAVAAVVVDGDEACPGLHQTPGHEAGLAEEMAAVGIAHLGGLAAEVEGVARAGAGDEPQGALAEPVELETTLGVEDAALRVEGLEEPAATADAVDVVVADRLQPLDPAPQLFVGAVAPVGVVGEAPAVDLRGQGADARPEPAAVLAGTDVLAVLLQATEPVGDDRVGGEVADSIPRGLLLEVLDDRAHRGPVLRRGAEAAPHRDLPAVAGLDVVPATAVVVEVVRHRADDAVAVGDVGEAGEMLANPQARRAAADRGHRPADVGRRLRLHVERLVLARAAEEKKEDHRLGPAGPGVGRRLLGGQDPGKREPEEPRAAGLEHRAAAGPAGQGAGAAQDVEHGGSPGACGTDDGAPARGEEYTGPLLRRDGKPAGQWGMAIFSPPAIVHIPAQTVRSTSAATRRTPPSPKTTLQPAGCWENI